MDYYVRLHNFVHMPATHHHPPPPRSPKVKKRRELERQKARSPTKSATELKRQTANRLRELSEVTRQKRERAAAAAAAKSNSQRLMSTTTSQHGSTTTTAARRSSVTRLATTSHPHGRNNLTRQPQHQSSIGQPVTGAHAERRRTRWSTVDGQAARMTQRTNDNKGVPAVVNEDRATLANGEAANSGDGDDKIEAARLLAAERARRALHHHKEQRKVEQKEATQRRFAKRDERLRRFRRRQRAKTLQRATDRLQQQQQQQRQKQQDHHHHHPQHESMGHGDSVEYLAPQRRGLRAALAAATRPATTTTTTTTSATAAGKPPAPTAVPNNSSSPIGAPGHDESHYRYDPHESKPPPPPATHGHAPSHVPWSPSDLATPKARTSLPQWVLEHPPLHKQQTDEQHDDDDDDDGGHNPKYHHNDNNNHNNRGAESGTGGPTVAAGAAEDSADVYDPHKDANGGSISIDVASVPPQDDLQDSTTLFSVTGTGNSDFTFGHWDVSAVSTDSEGSRVKSNDDDVSARPRGRAIVPADVVKQVSQCCSSDKTNAHTQTAVMYSTYAREYYWSLHLQCVLRLNIRLIASCRQSQRATSDCPDELKRAMTMLVVVVRRRRQRRWEHRNPPIPATASRQVHTTWLLWVPSIHCCVLFASNQCTRVVTCLWCAYCVLIWLLSITATMATTVGLLLLLLLSSSSLLLSSLLLSLLVLLLLLFQSVSSPVVPGSPRLVFANGRW